MRQETRIHNAWADFERAKKKGLKLTPFIGKYQYLFSSEKGVISCIELLDYFMDGLDLWEIHCNEGDLFEDIERFESFEEAKERCRELLD